MKTFCVGYLSTCFASQGIIPLLLFFFFFQNTPLTTAGTISGFNESSNLDPSIGVVIVVLVCAFFMTGCIATYIGGCANASAVSSVSAPSYGRYLLPVVSATHQGFRSATQGLDRSEIESLPTFVYSDVKRLQIGKRALECAVCLTEFEDDETLRLMPKCEHAFHPQCIDPWLSVRSSCPLCRSDLVPIAAEIRVFDGEENRSRNSSRFVRSNSTGHSFTVSDRFRLRLPEEVRRKVEVEAKMRRVKSLGMLPAAASSRAGFTSSQEILVAIVVD